MVTDVLPTADAPKQFDVICAGKALWSLEKPGSVGPAQRSMTFLPGGGALSAALLLAQRGVRVGLATSVEDDRAGRALVAKVARTGIDTDGVCLTPPRTEVVFVDGSNAAREIMPFHEEEQPVAVPKGWSSQVLLISTLSPAVPYCGTLCLAARRARREATAVVVDVDAKWHVWAGHNASSIRMLLREADVVHCTAWDLAVLDWDVATVRDILRPTSVLVALDDNGDAKISGPFGVIAEPRRGKSSTRRSGEGDAFVASICQELATAGHGLRSGGDLWAGLLRA